MSPGEREFLENSLKRAPGLAKRWTSGFGNALVLWAGSLLLLVLTWKLVAWLIRLASGFDFGPKSPFAIWFVIVVAPLCAIFAVISSLRWVRRWSDPRPQLRADLDRGQVLEEHYRFTAVKRFQEQEHGGLMYFFLTDDDKVFVRFDHESQDLGVQDKDPLSSTFQARSELLLIRAPNTRYIINEQVSGDLFDASAPLDLTEAPQRWPEQEAYCDIPWNELETRLSIR
ncbi:MAG TPA: hypothetical protein VNX47_15030 [Nevskia sp.]|jgi:hypothetical protein|nr:hypothetical protein [Nevskia sp.]